MVYAVDFPEPETAVEWSLTDGGVTRAERTYRPRFYVAATAGNELGRIAEALGEHPAVVALGRERHRPGWRRDETEVLAVDVATPEAVPRLASSVAGVGRPGSFRCFNVDLSPQFRYCLETGTDPAPSRRPRTLRLGTPPGALADEPEAVTATTPTGDEREFAGSPTDVASRVGDLVASVDPDVLRLSTGRLIPALFAASDGGPFRLGREPGYEKLAGESTYESYGRVGHSPARFGVPGRAVVDESNAFFLREAGLDGVLDLVERSHKPLQEAARASIGNVLTAIQIREASDRGVLVPWRSWRPEFFKSARTLEAADRGGVTFAPDVGRHEDVHELDFASLYPNIMRTRNVSPETVRCECHPDRSDVPGLGYGICPDRGYLPDVLGPLIEDRDAIKRAVRETDDPERRDELEGRSAAIKWLLVACFGYQGFDNAKFGRIECHEAINAFAREILLDSKETLEANGWRVVHGIVDSIWVTPADGEPQTPLDELAARITDDVGIRLEYEDAYDWIAFVPRRHSETGALTKYFGRIAGREEYTYRGIECRQRSTSPFVADLQTDLVRALDETRRPESVCDRLGTHLTRLRRGDVAATELAVTKRVSKERDAYSRYTRAVAALERSADVGRETRPGQSTRYVVVDDDRRDRDRVALLAEDPDSFDESFYRERAIEAAESVLSPLDWDRDRIRSYLSNREDARLDSFG